MDLGRHRSGSAKPLELARARAAVRILVCSLLGCHRLGNRRFAIAYRVFAAVLFHMIFLRGLLSHFWGKIGNPGSSVVGSSVVGFFACGDLVGTGCFFVGVFWPRVVGVAFFDWRYFSSGFPCYSLGLWGVSYYVGGK